MITTEDIYRQGFIDAMTCYAVWKDGRQNVGSPEKLLGDEIQNLKSNSYYSPPFEEVT